MKQILKLVFLLVIGQTAFAQAPSNYTNINGRYRWIAGMFDSTFHIPKGSTPSLRTGGSTNAGALFYKTGDSSLYIYTGTQWLKIAGAAGFVPYSGATQNVNLGIYDILAKSATIADTGGTAATILQRTSINTDIVLYAKAVGNRGFAAIIEQADSNATGTQYQTIFRKSMMPGTGNPAPGAGVSWYTQISNDNNNNPAVSVYRARIIDSTGYASGLIRQTSTEFWTRKNNVWDTTLVLNGGNVGINTGQNGIDSALTVANGTWLKRGVRMSALPTGVGTKSVRIDANGNLSTTDTTTTTGYVPYTGATQDLDMGTFSVNAKSFHIKGTAGQGHLGLKHQTATPSISANESAVYADVNGDLGLKNDNLYTSIFKTSLNSADRTYTFQNKSYTIGDSADIAARVKYTDTASMLSPYLRSNVAAATYVPQTRTITINGTSQDLSANRTYNVGTVTSVATNTGTGITGGTITSSGTIAADTLLLSTRAWRQKGVDSVASLINTRISGTTNYIPKFTSSSAIGNSIMYEGSNVIGIGTISPGATLDVNGNSFIRTGQKIAGYFNTNAGDGYILNIGVASNIGYLQSLNGSTPNTLSLDGNDIRFRIGSFSEAMRLDASGRLLIGTTTSSGAKLDVVSGAGLNTYFNSTGTGIYLQIANNGNNLGYIGDGSILISGGSSTDFVLRSQAALAFSTNGNTERMRLDASGNLGLGVTPSAWGSAWKASQVQQFGIATLGADEADLSLNAYNDNNGWLYINTNYATQYRQGSGSHKWFTAPSGTAGNAISFTQAMTLDASGRLGIGTTSPAFKLHVQGADIGGVFDGTSTSGSGFVSSYNSADGNAMQMRSYGNATGSTIFGNSSNKMNAIWSNGDALYALGTIGATPMIFGTSNTERMRITSGGELLINTTSDAGDYKLQVAGNAYVNGVGKFTTSGTKQLYINSSSTNTALIDFSNNDNGFSFGFNSTTTQRFTFINGGLSEIASIDGSGNQILSGSIKTAAPSGGTAKPWKLGQAGVSVGGANTTAVAVEIDGTVYYLLTAYLPEPEPDPAALPSSGPSASYKPYNKPIPVKTTKDVEIENLRKEIEELKQLIKNK